MNGRKTLFFLLTFCFLLSPLSVRAEDSPGSDKTKGLWETFSASLPDMVKDALPAEPDGEKVKEALDFSHLCASIIAEIKGEENGLRGVIFQTLGVLLLFGTAEILGKSRKGVSMAVGLGCAFCMAELFFSVAEQTASFLTDLGKLAGGVSALYTGVYAMGGLTASAGTAGVGFSGFISLLSVLGTGILVPFSQILFVLTPFTVWQAFPCLAEAVKQMKSLFVWTLTFIGVLFSASLAFQNSLSSSLDSLAMRTVKFSVGQALPTVGTAVSAAVGTLASSLSLVKNTAGGGATLCFLLLFLPLLARLFLLRFLLAFGGGVFASLGAETVGKTAEGYRRVLDFLLSASALFGGIFLILLLVCAGGIPA
ncbi:MAG: hypothetical protein MJ078_01250 [Clostridia bacterium]|nr:hypothetical protein [Clostridia bacterium]